MKWKKGIESLRLMFTGFFFGGMLIFLQKDNSKMQAVMLSIAAALLLFSVFASEVLKYRANKNKNQKNVSQINE